DVQAKLLRFLQDGEVRPVGAPKPIKTDVRVIAATNRNMEEEVRAGRFRSDLFYRLNVLRIHVPSLRDRREEIPYLAAHFLKSYKQKAGRKGLQLSDEAMEVLCNYDWPGNVRQLQNEIQRLVSRSMNNEVIEPERLSPEIRTGTSSQPAQTAAIVGDLIVIPLSLPNLTRHDELQRLSIIHALTETEGNVTQAAEMLGMTRYGLTKAIERLGIKVEEKEDS